MTGEHILQRHWGNIDIFVSIERINFCIFAGDDFIDRTGKRTSSEHCDSVIDDTFANNRLEVRACKESLIIYTGIWEKLGMSSMSQRQKC